MLGVPSFRVYLLWLSGPDTATQLPLRNWVGRVWAQSSPQKFNLNLQGWWRARVSAWNPSVDGMVDVGMWERSRMAQQLEARGRGVVLQEELLSRGRVGHQPTPASYLGSREGQPAHLHHHLHTTHHVGLSIRPPSMSSGLLTARLDLLRV